MYYLDTNTCIYFLNGKYASIRDILLQTRPDRIRIPAIVKAELLTGAYKSSSMEKVMTRLNAFLQPFVIEPFTDDRKLEASYEFIY